MRFVIVLAFFFYCTFARSGEASAQDVPGSGLPLPDGTLKPLPPIMSACVGCHTTEPAKAHMEAQIAAVGRESCAVCHGRGRDFSVEKVHRR